MGLKKWIWKRFYQKEYDKLNAKIDIYEKHRNVDKAFNKARELISRDYKSSTSMYKYNGNKLGEIKDYQNYFIYNLDKLIDSIKRPRNITRIVDLMIQFFFTFGIMKADWLIHEGQYMQQRQHTFQIFRRRLEFEHGYSFNNKHILKNLVINKRDWIQMASCFPYEIRQSKKKQN